MRIRVVAASAAGVLLHGVVLLRLGVFGVLPAAGRGLLALGGNVGVALVLPRSASAATAHFKIGRSVTEQPATDTADPPSAETAVAPADGSADPPRETFGIVPVNQGDESVRSSVASGGRGAASPGPNGACPGAMILVEGDYCPEVEHTCKHWLEDKGRYAYYRCEEYSKATCLSKAREHKRFCIDRDEHVERGEKLPASHKSWSDAERTCTGLGKRVCLESEWNFACEGEQMLPYPYGWKRDPEACNADRTDIFRPDGELKDLRVGADDKPRCTSPFGVHNLSGNLEEWTTIDSSARYWPPRPAMKGAYWQPSRNHCRANQTAHDRFYKGTETGFRCCADPGN